MGGKKHLCESLVIFLSGISCPIWESYYVVPTPNLDDYPLTCFREDMHLLHTDPHYQGRGAGGMLVSQAIEEAARRGLPAYLESSEAAHQLYLKHGFRDLEELTTDFSTWGLKTPHRVWAMIHDNGA
jgi:GNAT superfamily N-acetyltransferase